MACPWWPPGDDGDMSRPRNRYRQQPCGEDEDDVKIVQFITCESRGGGVGDMLHVIDSSASWTWRCVRKLILITIVPPGHAYLLFSTKQTNTYNSIPLHISIHSCICNMEVWIYQYRLPQVQAWRQTLVPLQGEIRFVFENKHIQRSSESVFMR